MMNILLQQHHVHIATKPQSLLHKQMIPAVDLDSMEYHMAPEENRPYHPPPQTYASCFGLPYQDHNYGAPPPPTPPASPSPPPPPPQLRNGLIDIEDISATAEIETTETLPAPEEPEIGGIYTPDDSITRCICDFLHDDGYMICCDRCSVWQHVDCMGLDRNTIPDTYLCEKCEPRKVEKQRAVELQLRKRAEIAALDTSSTETEDETKGLSNFGVGKKAKNRRKEKKLKGTLGNKKTRKGKKDKEEKKERKKREKQTTQLPNRRKSQQNATVKRTPPKSPRSPKARNAIQLVKSPVQSVKSPPQSVKSPTQTVKSPTQTVKSPTRSPVQPVKSPVQPVKSPVQTAAKTTAQPVKSPVHTSKDSLPLPEIAVVADETNDTCNGSTGINVDGYEVARFNQYSVDVENLMASKKYNGQHWDSNEAHPSQLQAQLCEVVHIGDQKKGLEANEDLISSQILIEYKGKVMLREQYDKENMFFKRVHPFVLFYSGFEGLDICIDASTYGNDARYVRRSCTPNAEVQHVVENGRVHFYVYSSKGISKGAEISIPFDFNYQECNYGVECACSKANCPVARFYSRKEEKLSRKKRSSKSTSLVDPKQVVEEVKPNNPVRMAGTKRRRVTPLKLLTTTNKQEHIQVSSPPPTRRSAPALIQSPPRSTENTVLSPTKSETTSGTTPPAQFVSQHSLDSELDEHDHRKMTREERKMEAIMKAFEKLEKREERRKEALARLETTKRTPRERDKEPKEPPKEEKVEEKKPDIKPGTPKPKKGKKKKLAVPARRRSRFNSGASGASSTVEALSSADESCSATPNLPTSATSVTTSADSSGATTPSTATANKSFRFPKTKKHLMNEWLHEKGQDLQKPLTIKTDSLDTIPTEDTKEFVMQVHSPHSFSHLRRGSFGSSNVAVKAASPAVQVQVASSETTSIGSAKKRWLRQAMYESTSTGPIQSPSGAMSPVHNGPISPGLNCCANSPGSSPPIDFVTPLKKRRLARESISMDSPYPPTPSTPTPGQGSDLSPGMCDSSRFGGEGEGLLVTAEDTTKLTPPNGFKPLHHFTPVMPLTPNDNLFERFGSPTKSGLPGTVDKQGSLDSSISESLLSPTQDFSSPSGTFEDDTHSILNKESYSATLPSSKAENDLHVHVSRFSSVEPDPHKPLALVKKELTPSVLETDGPLPSQNKDLATSEDFASQCLSAVNMVKQEIADDFREVFEGSNSCIEPAKPLESGFKCEMLCKDESLSEELSRVGSGKESPSTCSNSVAVCLPEQPSGTVLECHRIKLRQSLQPVPEETKEDTEEEERDFDTHVPLNLKLSHETACRNLTEAESPCASTSGTIDMDTSSISCRKQVDCNKEAEALATSDEKEDDSESKTKYDPSEDVDVCSSNIEDYGMVGPGPGEVADSGLAPVDLARKEEDTREIVNVESSRGAMEESAAVPSSSSAADCLKEHGHQPDEASRGQSSSELSEQTVSCSTDQPEHLASGDSRAGKSQENEVDSCADKEQCVAAHGICDPESCSTEISSSEHHVEENVLSSSREEGEISDSETTGSTSFNSVDSSVECSTASSVNEERATQSGIACRLRSCLPSPCNRHEDSMEVDSTSSQPNVSSQQLDSQVGEGTGVSEMVSSSSTPLGWENEAGLASTSSSCNSRTGSGDFHSEGLDQECEAMEVEPSASSATSTEEARLGHPVAPYQLSSVGCPAESTTSFNGTDNCVPSSSSFSVCLANSSNSSSSTCTSAITSSSNIGGSQTGHGVSASSSNNSNPNTPIKKKVSLLEYRKRMKDRRLESCSSQSSQGSVDGGSKTPTLRTIATPPSTKDFPPTLAPLPLFESTGPDRESDKVLKGFPLSPLSGRNDGQDLGDVRWNNNATTVERIREQAPLSLTERLRREFGVDASESEEEEEKKEPESSTVSPSPMYGLMNRSLGPGIGDRVGVPPPPPPTGIVLGHHGPSPVPPPPPPHVGPPTPGAIPPLMSLSSYPTKKFNANALTGGTNATISVSGQSFPNPGTSSSTAGAHIYSQALNPGTAPSFPQPVPQSVPPPPPPVSTQTSQYPNLPGSAPDSAHQAVYQYPAQGQGLLPHPPSQPQQPQSSQPQYTTYNVPASSSGGLQQYPAFTGNAVGQTGQPYGNFNTQPSQQGQQGFPSAIQINYNHGYSSHKKNNFHPQ